MCHSLYCQCPSKGKVLEFSKSRVLLWVHSVRVFNNAKSLVLLNIAAGRKGTKAFWIECAILVDLMSTTSKPSQVVFVLSEMGDDCLLVVIVQLKVLASVLLAIITHDLIILIDELQIDCSCIFAELVKSEAASNLSWDSKNLGDDKLVIELAVVGILVGTSRNWKW